MFRRKTAALCILALLMATISPAAKADRNGQCDPYSAVLPPVYAVYVAVKVTAAVTWRLANTPAGAAVIGATAAWILNEATDDDDDGTVPEHSHDVPQHNHDIPLHFHPDDDDNEGSSSKGEDPDESETPEGPSNPGESGGTDQSGGGYGSCPTNPYTF